MILGYARVSTDDQSLNGQRDALEAAGAGWLFADRITGTVRHRPELDRMMDQLRAGDLVMVTKYSRFAHTVTARWPLMLCLERGLDQGAPWHAGIMPHR